MNYNALLLAIFNAYYGWLVEQDCIPEIIVNPQEPNVRLPEHLKMTPSLVLNISMTSTDHFQATESGLSFSARFGGKPFLCYIPLHAIKAFVSRSMEPRVAIPMLNIDEMLLANGVVPTSAPIAPPPVTSAPPSAVPSISPSTSGEVEAEKVETQASAKVVSLFPAR